MDDKPEDEVDTDSYTGEAKASKPSKPSKPSAGSKPSKPSKSKYPTVYKRKASGEEHKREPSKRWELQEGADLPARHAKQWELLGYWAKQHVELRGCEDPKLFVSDGSRLIGKARAIGGWVDRWMDGDFEKAKEGIRKILTVAEPLGYPVALMYYFRPTEDGPLPDLMAGKPRRKLTPIEENDLTVTMGIHKDPKRKAEGREQAKRLLAKLRGEEDGQQ